MRIFIILSILTFFTSIYGDEHDGKGHSSLPNPVIGHWNVSDHDGKLCIKMDAGIRLDIVYETNLANVTTKMTKIVSDGNETVITSGSCQNSSTDTTEMLRLQFNKNRILSFYFSRDKNITGDKNEKTWALYNVSFEFVYDSDFPDAADAGNQTIRFTEVPLKLITAHHGQSYGCSANEPFHLDNITVTLDHLRVQAFVGGADYGKVTLCSKDQTSDLIPIIIGAALAALVVIVLVAYLIGRARARTANYGNI